MSRRTPAAAAALLILVTLDVLGAAAQAPAPTPIPVTPTCTTDTATGRVTCSATVDVTGQPAGSIFTVSGEARHPTTGQRVTAGPAVMPGCGDMQTALEAGKLTMTWTCEAGFVITFTVNRK